MGNTNPSYALFDPKMFLGLNYTLSFLVRNKKSRNFYTRNSKLRKMRHLVQIPHEKREIEEFLYKKFLTRKWGTRNSKPRKLRHVVIIDVILQPYL